MNRSEPSPQPTSIQVGPDLVTVEGDALVIYARRPFPDWQVREFQRQPIFFQETKYYLRGKRHAAAPYAMRYELVPWPAELHDESSRHFVYDEEFVAERDQAVRTDRGRDFLHCLLLPLYPVLGFCWSGFKERVLWPIGFEPSAISSAATMAGFGLALVDGILIGYLDGGFFYQLVYIGVLPLRVTVGAAKVIDYALLILLGLDCAIRYNQGLRGDTVPDGFLEWLVPKRGKRTGV